MNIVAELGRPETPSETAYRKAENSRLYRERKTVNNLVLSLLVTVGLVVVIFLMVPRGTGTFAEHSIDVVTLAEEAEPGAGRALAAPAVPEAWKAKQAVLGRTGNIVTWRINYTTVDEATGHESYAAVVQAFTVDGSPVDEDWIAQQFEEQTVTGSEVLGGSEWAVYDHTDRNPDNANMLFGLQTELAGDTILVFGTDTPATIRILATQVTESLSQQ